MSSHEPFEPTVDLLRRLPGVSSPGAEATSRVRRRCHAVLTHRAERQAHNSQSRGWRGRLFDVFLLLPLCLYLLISIIETVRVASSL